MILFVNETTKAHLQLLYVAMDFELIALCPFRALLLTSSGGTIRNVQYATKQAHHLHMSNVGADVVVSVLHRPCECINRI